MASSCGPVTAVAEMGRTRRPTVAGMLSLLMLLATAGFAAQQLKSLPASANGKGSIKVGQEEFDLNAVVIKLTWLRQYRT